MAAQPDLDLLVALVSGLDSARDKAANQATGLAHQATANFENWYSTAAITDWSQDLSSNVQAVLKVLAGMVDAYLAEIIGAMTGQHVRATGTVDTAALRTGVTPAGVYGRVADTYRYQQSVLDTVARNLTSSSSPTPPTLQSPIEAAMQRAGDAAALDTQLTVQQQSQQSLTTDRRNAPVIGWRRMVHPEISKTGSCGLCIAASTRIYKTGQLMPIHTNCNCLPIPFIEGYDPGALIDDRALGRLYGDAGGTTAELLKKTRYQIHDNGELGPTLAPEGAKQRTPRQVRADTGTASRPQTESRQQAKVRQLHDSLARSLRRVDTELLPADPAQWADYRQTLANRVDDLERQLTAP